MQTRSREVKLFAAKGEIEFLFLLCLENNIFLEAIKVGRTKTIRSNGYLKMNAADIHTPLPQG